MVQIKVVTTPTDVPAGALEHAAIPALPLTLQEIFASAVAGATALAVPVMVSVKVRVAPKPVPPLPTRTELVGATLVTVAVIGVVAAREVKLVSPE